MNRRAQHTYHQSPLKQAHTQVKSHFHGHKQP